MEQSPTTVRALALVATPTPARSMNRLCRHFAHKAPVRLEERSGQITFNSGECHLDVEEGVLRLSLSSPDSAQMAHLQDVVGRHLLRVSAGEDLQIEWRAA